MVEIHSISTSEPAKRGKNDVKPTFFFFCHEVVICQKLSTLFILRAIKVFIFRSKLYAYRVHHVLCDVF